MVAQSLTQALERLILALWFGTGVGVGYLAVPILFARLADPALAGDLAAEMFRWTGWLGLTAGVLLLGIYRQLSGRWRHWRTPVVAAMFGATAVIQFLLAPAMSALRALPAESRDGFGALHGASSVLFLLVTLLGLLLLARPPLRHP